MKTSVIPAQITTVEDRIAGNLNLVQIVLLLLALFISVAIYAIFPQRLHFTFYKIPLMIIASSIFLILSLRVKGKVLVEWLIVLARYNARPRYYIYNKSSLYLRDVILPEEPKVKPKSAVKPKVVAVKEVNKITQLADIIRVEQILANPRYQLSFKFGKEGGINAVVSEIKK